MNFDFHATKAETVPADEIVCLCNIERNHVSTSSSGPVVKWMVRDAIVEFSLVPHLKHILLVPVKHKNWRKKGKEELLNAISQTPYYGHMKVTTLQGTF